MMKLSQVLKRIMDERDLNISKLASISDIPKTTINNWLSGHSPSVEQAQKLSRSLGISLHQLCFDVEDENTPLMKIFKSDVFSGTFEIKIRRVNIESEDE